MTHYEAEVLPGLEPFAAAELRRTLPDAAVQAGRRAGSLPFDYDGDPRDLAVLRTVTAVYRVITVDVPRPKAFLGHQVFTALTRAIRDIIDSQSGFQTLSLDAAGADSSVMQRVQRELAAAVGLSPTDEKGDLHLRIRRAKSDGWDILIRLTPRPLVTRSWRLHNVPGALNGAVASVMSGLTMRSADDSVLNLCCGSGSLLIERTALTPAKQMIGVDIDLHVLDIARQHLDAANVSGAALVCGDVTALPFAPAQFDVLLADVPFGQLVGSHQANTTLYPALLREAARVARHGARFALITHEKRLMNDVLSKQLAWQVERTVSINLNGLHPDIWLLTRRA